MNIPSGKQLLITIFVGGVALIAVYTTGLLPVVIFAALLALVIYALYVVAVRVHKRLKTPNGPRGGNRGGNK